MAVTVKVVSNNIPSVSAGIHGRLKALVHKTAEDISADIKRTLDEGARSGVVYERPGGRTHQASAPGEPPKTDHGTLVQSVHATHDGPLTATVHIGSQAADYAEKLELGSAKIRPRPYVRPAAERARPKFDAAARAAFRGI